MRNLTREAFEQAKEHLIRQNPRLANELFRRSLDLFAKQRIKMLLVQLTEQYENQMIMKIKSKAQ